MISTMFLSQVGVENSGYQINLKIFLAASIQGICRVRNKDIRKFLDGIYVSDKGTILSDDA
jgi:large subunit ribosomal protein L9e